MNMSKDYNATVNLPKTDFPMRAGPPKREPAMLQAWEEMDLYHKMVERNVNQKIVFTNLVDRLFVSIK